MGRRRVVHPPVPRWRRPKSKRASVDGKLLPPSLDDSTPRAVPTKQAPFFAFLGIGSVSVTQGDRWSSVSAPANLIRLNELLVKLCFSTKKRRRILKKFVATGAVPDEVLAEDFEQWLRRKTG